MDMQNLEYRKKARIVAYVEVVCDVFVISALIIAGGFLFYALVVSSNRKEDSEIEATTGDGSEPTERESKTFAYILEVAVAIKIVLLAIQLRISYHLLKATDVDMDMTEALQKATTWRNYSLFTTIVAIMFLVLTESFINIGITVAIRGAILYIVHKYIKNLQLALSFQEPIPNYTEELEPTCEGSFL